MITLGSETGLKRVLSESCGQRYTGSCLQFICSYLLRPFAFLMGVPWEDCDVVAELLGIKTFLNEFVAYLRLADIIGNRRDMTGGRTISVSRIGQQTRYDAPISLVSSQQFSWSQNLVLKVHSPNLPKRKCISKVVRICIKIIFHLSKL